jgi:hypothetical protein
MDKSSRPTSSRQSRLVNIGGGERRLAHFAWLESGSGCLIRASRLLLRAKVRDDSGPLFARWALLGLRWGFQQWRLGGDAAVQWAVLLGGGGGGSGPCNGGRDCGPWHWGGGGPQRCCRGKGVGAMGGGVGGWHALVGRDKQQSTKGEREGGVKPLTCWLVLRACSPGQRWGGGGAV